DGSVAPEEARPRTAGELKHDQALVHQLRGAVAAVADDEGWAYLGGVGSHLGNQGSFDPRNYGYRSLSALIDAVDLFEVPRPGPGTAGTRKTGQARVPRLGGAGGAVADAEGWAYLGGVGSHLGNQGSFDPRNYGYRSLSALIDAVDLFEVRRDGQKVLVRERP